MYHGVEIVVEKKLMAKVTDWERLNEKYLDERDWVFVEDK
jgi:hypothetical protein